MCIPFSRNNRYLCERETIVSFFAASSMGEGSLFFHPIILTNENVETL